MTTCEESEKAEGISKTPEHYSNGIQPWDLQKHMPSWGSVFIDARRTDAQEYLFRDKKGTLSKRLSDAKKALHNCEEIVKEVERMIEDHKDIS